MFIETFGVFEFPSHLYFISYEVTLPYFLTQSLLPSLKSSKLSQVMNIGSIGGMSGYSKFPGLSVYSSSKGALSILTECLATELDKEGILVNCYALGSVQTEMLESAFPGMEAGSSASSMACYLVSQLLSNSGIVSGKTLPVAGSGI
ncbi:SDR family oxidoreductase [Halocola ammonii]